MKASTKFSVTGLLLLLGGGLWLIAAPFALSIQAFKASWSGSTINMVATGGLVAALASTGLLTLGISALRRIVRNGAGLPPTQ